MSGSSNLYTYINSSVLPADPAVLQLVWTPGSYSRCGCAVQKAGWDGYIRARLSGWSLNPTCPPPGAPPSASNRRPLSVEPACSLNGPESWSCWWRTAGGQRSRCSVSGQMVRTGPPSTSSPARRVMEPGADAWWASDMSCWATGVLHPTRATAGFRVSNPSLTFIQVSINCNIWHYQWLMNH